MTPPPHPHASKHSALTTCSSNAVPVTRRASTALSGNQGSGTQARRSRAGPSHLAMVARAREHVASFQGFDPNPPYAVLQSGWGWTSLSPYTVGRSGQNQTQAANRVSRSGQRLSCTPPRPANALLLLPQRTFLLISQFWGSCHFNERGKMTKRGTCSRNWVPRYQKNLLSRWFYPIRVLTTSLFLLSCNSRFKAAEFKII